jgi:hypothetical protein
MGAGCWPLNQEKRGAVKRRVESLHDSKDPQRSATLVTIFCSV